MAALAAAMFVPLFITRGVGGFDFWWWMSANVAALVGLAAAQDKEWRSRVLDDLKSRRLFKIAGGLASALALYGVFYAGNLVSRWLFSFAGGGITDVYAFKGAASPLRITLLMLALIGPGEELFWRGFLQRRLELENGPWRGFVLAAAVYTLVHVGSGNLMLVLAAGVCSLFWGLLYLRTRSLLLNMVSHTAWDLLIFVLFPVG